jgi:hypothetical protein
MSKDSLQAHFEAYWLQTVLEDRAESAPPPATAPACEPGSYEWFSTWLPINGAGRR